MKMILICATLFLSFAAMAETIVLTETYVPRSSARPDISTTYFMDTNTGIGYADIRVTVTEYPRETFPRRMDCRPYGGERRGRYGRPYPGRRHPPVPRRNCVPRPLPAPRIVTLVSERVEIPNLNLIGNEMIYNGPVGEVNCGTLGRSRVLRTPTLYLSGKCNLNARISRDKLTVTFTTR